MLVMCFMSQQCDPALQAGALRGMTFSIVHQTCWRTLDVPEDIAAQATIVILHQHFTKADFTYLA